MYKLNELDIKLLLYIKLIIIHSKRILYIKLIMKLLRKSTF